MTPFERCVLFLDKHGHYRVGQVVEWYNKGETDEGVAKILGISRPTWTRFKKVILKEVYVLTEPMENALKYNSSVKRDIIEESEKIIEESRMRLVYSRATTEAEPKRA